MDNDQKYNMGIRLFWKTADCPLQQLFGLIIGEDISFCFILTKLEQSSVLF